MKLGHILFLLVLLLCLAGPTLAAILEVPTNYSTIQAAIDAAAAGDTVLVLPDTYYENISFRGKSVVVASRYLLTPDPQLIRRTVIDGSLPDHPDTGSVVVFTGCEEAAALLYGLALANGLGTVVPGSYAGGGIMIGPGSSPTIMYNLVLNNSAIKGGGLAVRGGNPHLARNVFAGNSAQSGGGLMLEDADVVVTHNVCYDNSATGNGGAVYLTTSTVQFAENVIAENQAAAGGGVFAENSDCLPSYCNFYDNTHGDLIGVIAAGFGDTSWGVNFNLQPIDIYGNLFRAPEFAAVEDADFAPACNSPLIDAGAGLPAGFPQGGKRTDLGAFEVDYRPGDLNHDGKINITDITLLVNVMFVLSAPPCPFYTADLDCNRRVNMSDLVSLIAYWRGSGPVPCALSAN